MWSYAINGITALAVSENGDFIAVGCQDGHYYIFNTFGNLVGSGYAQDSVRSLDITDTGNVIMAISREYIFCTADGTQISATGVSDPKSVFISSEGTVSLACCRKNIFINLGNSMVQQVNISSELPLGAVSSDGTLICAASDEYLYIFGIFENTLNSQLYDAGEKIEHLFASENGKKVIFSTTNKIGYIDSEAEEGNFIHGESSILNMAASPTGDIIVIATGASLVWLEGDSETELPVDGNIPFLSLIGDSPLTVTGKNNKIQIIKPEGTSLFAYELESPIKALEVSHKGDLLVVCTENSVYTFQLSQEVYTNTRVIPTASRKSLPLTSELKEVWSVPVAEDAGFLTEDMDGDGLTEILLIEGTKLKLFDGKGNLESERDLGRTYEITNLLDVDGDTFLEIPLSFSSTQFEFYI